jgi:hypothetical protein
MAEIFLFTTVQTGSEVHPAFYTIGMGGGLSLGRRVKRPKREADQSPPSIAGIRIAWSQAYFPPYVSVP